MHSYTHSHISLTRRPTGTFFARALVFTKDNMEQFFYNLTTHSKFHSKFHFAPNRIYNVDETGLSVVQSKAAEVVGRKGKRYISLLTSLLKEGNSLLA